MTDNATTGDRTAEQKLACDTEPHTYERDPATHRVEGDRVTFTETCSVCGLVRQTVTATASGAILRRFYNYPATGE